MSKRKQGGGSITMTLHVVRTYSHAPACASGARAEQRGPCDCGAVDSRPYRARFTDTKHEGRRLIELELDRPLTTGEAVELSLVLQEMTREEGARWAREDMRREKRDGQR